jgi:hypothetical protein
MKAIIDNYNLFFQFIEHELPGGFMDIARINPVILKIEKFTEANNQFFLVSDLIQLKIIFTSLRIIDMLGVEPKDVDPSVFVKLIHPDDLRWYNTAQTKLFTLGQQIFILKTGNALISTNFRIKNSLGQYQNTLVQCYLFFTNNPYKTVYMLQVFTDISWFKKLRLGHHFYIGYDPSYFRYPDENLLLTGNIFSPINLRSLN